MLVPLRPSDADDMVDVLADDRLHEFIGGHPATLADLRARYERLVAGSPHPDESWFNWIVRTRAAGQAVGTVQATLIHTAGRWSAHGAWVIGVPWQGRGYASEAARALVDWLMEQGLDEITAHIHPAHDASAKVARRAGLQPTDEDVDGERVWRLTICR